MNALHLEMISEYHQGWWARFSALTHAVQAWSRQRFYCGPGNIFWAPVSLAVQDIASYEADWRTLQLPLPRLWFHELALVDAACFLVRMRYEPAAEFQKAHSLLVKVAAQFCKTQVAM